jgi:hypothetical protein
MDHTARLRSFDQRTQVIARAIAGIPGVTATTKSEMMWSNLHVAIDGGVCGKNALDVSRQLRAGDPAIWVNADEEALDIWVGTLEEGDEEVVAARLKEALAK